VEADTWGRMSFDYQSTAGRCHDDYEIDRGTTVTGKLRFDNLWLDEDQFGSKLKADFNPHLDPQQRLEILITGESGRERCTIKWRGSNTTISLRNKERINRAMRSFSILTRNPNQEISHYLLETQAGRGTDTRMQSPAIREKAQRLAEKIRPLAAKLYLAHIPLYEAHKRLDEVLSDDGYEGENLRAWASWSPYYTRKIDGTAVKPSDAHATVAANLQLAVRHGIQAIREAGAEAAAEYLYKNLVLGPYSVRFEAITPVPTKTE
jgi:hypothetical protein